MPPPPPSSTLFPYTTLFRSRRRAQQRDLDDRTGNPAQRRHLRGQPAAVAAAAPRSEEHTSELQSHSDLVCRLLLEKKKNEDICRSRYITRCQGTPRREDTDP